MNPSSAYAGSGNAGLTNFYRNYGPKYAALVLVLDALKMVAAVVAACFILRGWDPVAKLFGGLFCILGHIFPATGIGWTLNRQGGNV